MVTSDLPRCPIGGGGTRRGRKGEIEDVPDQPHDVEDAKHPQGGHQLVGGRTPGDPADQATAVGALDRTAPRGLEILLHSGIRICKGLVRRGRLSN